MSHGYLEGGGALAESAALRCIRHEVRRYDDSVQSDNDGRIIVDNVHLKLLLRLCLAVGCSANTEFCGGQCTYATARQLVYSLRKGVAL